MRTNVESIKKQFLFDLADIYDAENRIAKALPRMIKDDISPELKLAILSRAKEIECHVMKVEQIFECFGATARGNAGKTLDELLSEGDEVAAEFMVSLSSAAELITALQKVEPHEIASCDCQREWEIASYGCLQEWASLLETTDAADLLEEILDEENELAGHETDEPRADDRRAM